MEKAHQYLLTKFYSVTYRKIVILTHNTENNCFLWALRQSQPERMISPPNTDSIRPEVKLAKFWERFLVQVT